MKDNERIKEEAKIYHKGKRLGALGELELMYKYVSTTSNGGRKHLLKKIKERLIEFEEAKE